MTIGVAMIASRCEGLIDFKVEAKRENIVRESKGRGKGEFGHSVEGNFASERRRKIFTADSVA